VLLNPAIAALAMSASSITDDAYDADATNVVLLKRIEPNRRATDNATDAGSAPQPKHPAYIQVQA
jgi:hypothetical protein